MGRPEEKQFDAVTLAQRAAAAQARGPPSAARRLLGWLADKLLPKRKTFARAMLCMLLACLPMITVLVIKAPMRMVPFIGVCGWLMWSADMGTDFRKQLRWMWQLSNNGPIVWTYCWFKGRLVRVAKATLGEKLEMQPLRPQVIGAATRRTSSTLIKWLPLLSSDFSRERYELQIAPIKEYMGLEASASAIRALTAVQ